MKQYHFKTTFMSYGYYDFFSLPRFIVHPYPGIYYLTGCHEPSHSMPDFLERIYRTGEPFRLHVELQEVLQNV